jgi:hypothetical protein
LFGRRRRGPTEAYWREGEREREREREETTKLLCGTTESMTKEGALLASCSQLLISRVFA